MIDASVAQRVAAIKYSALFYFINVENIGINKLQI